jgi:DNA-3-methyladenine glycosylase II
MTNTTTLKLDPEGPFSLDPIRTMSCGFLRGTRACAADGRVRLAFPEDATFNVVGAELAIASDGTVVANVTGARDRSVVKAQLARMLGLDHDARPFVRVLERDASLSAIALSRPGFRPPVAYSPYVMAGWCVLSQRLAMAQAAKIQVRMSESFGDVVEVAGERIASFPRPESILARNGFPGIAAEKWTRLQAVARAAAEGELEAKDLVALPYEDAHARLMTIRGVGAWSADGILIRGCGTTDALPLSEPRLAEAVRIVYGLASTPSASELSRIAERWRPFRTWISVLVISEAWSATSSPRSSTSRGSRPRRRSASASRATASSSPMG